MPLLAQKQDNGSKPGKAFASCTLSKAKKWYGIHKLAFLPLRLAIANSAPIYLYSGKFEVDTDNNPPMTAKLDAMG